MMIALVAVAAAAVASASASSLNVSWYAPRRMWAVDGRVGPELVLVAGQSYAFHVPGASPGGAFFIAREDTHDASALSVLGPADGASAPCEACVYSFAPAASQTRAVLYYCSSAAAFAGNRIHVESEQRTHAHTLVLVLTLAHSLSLPGHHRCGGVSLGGRMWVAVEECGGCRMCGVCGDDDT
jgi:hypothetical protein